MHYKIIIVLVAAVISIFLVTNNVSADDFVYTNQTKLSNGVYLSHSQLIGIQIKQACLILLKHGFNSTCPTYKTLAPLENTNPYYSGGWITKPYFHHGKPKIENYWITTKSSYAVSVDPSADFTARARMIYVEDGNFTYPDPLSNSTNGIIKVHFNRSVSNCEVATVAPSFWLINDTINYLESDCTKTSFNDTKIIYKKQTPFSFVNPFSSLHYGEYLKSIYHKGSFNVNQTGGAGPGDCRHIKCNFKDPYANW